MVSKLIFNRNSNGFALVIALQLMALVLILVLSIATIVQVDSVASANTLDRAKARQNALVGLHQAIGELQKSVGPDQRTTIKASIFDADPTTSTIEGVQNPHWLAVLPTVDSNLSGTTLQSFAESNRSHALGFSTLDLASGVQQPNSQQLRWLVSMSDAMRNNIGLNPSEPINKSAANLVGSDGEFEQIAFVRSDGSIQDEAVSVGKLPISSASANRVGSFAWWVDDNAMKANFFCKDTHYNPATGDYSMGDDNIDDKLYPLVQARHSNYNHANVSGNTLSYQQHLINNTLSRITDLTEVNLLDSSNEWATWLNDRSADITMNSMGVPVDVSTGRLKEDLTVYLESGIGLSATDNILRGSSSDTTYTGPSYPVSFGGDDYLPKFGILHSWNQLGRDLANGTATSQPQTPSRQGFHPIIKRVGITFSLALAEPPKDDPGPTDYQADMHLLAFLRVELWNPYTVPISPEKYLIEVALPRRVVMAEKTNAGSIKNPYGSGTFPVEFDLEAMIGADSSYAFGGNRRWLRMVINTADSSLTTSGLQPGETVIFSPAFAGNGSLHLNQYIDKSASTYNSSSTANIGEAQDILPRESIPVGFFLLGDKMPAKFNKQTDYEVRYQNLTTENAGRLQHRLSLLTPSGPELLSLTDPTRSIEFQRRTNWQGWDDFSLFSCNPAQFDPLDSYDPDDLLTNKEPDYYGEFPAIFALNTGVNFGNNQLFACYADAWRTASKRVRKDLFYDRDFAADRPMGLSNLRGGSLKQDLPLGSWKNNYGYSDGITATAHRILPTGPNYFELAINTNKGWSIAMGPWGNEGAIEGTQSKNWSSGHANAVLTSGTVHAYFDYPSRFGPIHSVGQLMHAQLNMLPFGPSYQVGYSRAPYNLDRDELAAIPDDSSSINNELIDLPYMLNASLWDRFYCSTIPQDEVLDFSGSEPTLPNNRHIFYRKSNGEWPAAEDLQANMLAFKTSASHLLVQGSFNINSTSVTAWEAFLLSKSGIEFDYWNSEPLINPSHDWHVAYNSKSDSSFVAFPRVPDPVYGVENNASFDSLLTSPQRTPYVRGGVHVTDRLEIRRLADFIVQEIKRRGPALSMADFINRRLIPDASTVDADYMGLMGTLDAAIHRSSQVGTRNGSGNVDLLNHNLIFDGSIENHSDLSPTNTNEENLYATPTGTTESSFEAFPAYLMQGDILANLGSSMSARTDTFTIHAYGDSIDPITGSVSASARCEALVQRIAEPVDPSDDIVNPSGEFGRKFVVLKIRWLN